MRRAAALAVVAACGGDPPPRDRPRDALEVVARLPGAAADTVDAQLALPISRALTSLGPGVATVASTARADHASIVIEIAPGFELDKVRTDVERALIAIAGQLPAARQPLQINRIFRDTTLGRYLILDPAMSTHDASARWRRLDRELVTVPGVFGHRACGVASTELRVHVDPVAALLHHVDVGTIVDAVRPTAARSLEDIENLGIAQPGILLRDVALVSLDVDRPCVVATSLGPGIAGTVTLGGADRAATWDRVLATARGLGLEVLPLPAAATLIASVDRNRVALAAPPATAAGTALPGVRWTIAELEPAALRISYGLAADAAPDAIAAALEADADAPIDSAVVTTGPGLIVRDAVIRTDDPAADRLAGAAMALDGEPAIARVGCIGCASVALQEPTIDAAGATARQLDPGKVVQMLEALVRGTVVGEARIGDEPVAVRVLIDRGPGTDPLAGIADVMMRARDDVLVALGNVVTVTTRPAPIVVLREAGERVVVVRARGRAGESADDVDRALRAAFPTAVIRAAPLRP